VVLREFARVILGAAPIFCGIALVEDQHHQTAEIEVLRPENIVREEGRLFKKAQALLAGVPFDEIDLLIVDRDRPRHCWIYVHASLLDHDDAARLPHLRARFDPGEQCQRNRDWYGGLHYGAFCEIAQFGIHLHECADLAWDAGGEDSHLIATRSRQHWLRWRLQARRRCAWCGLPTRSTWSAFKFRKPALARLMDTPS
jgi:hypothetical protein